MSATTPNEVVLDRMEEVGDKIIAFVQDLGFDPRSVLSVELNSKGAVVTELVDRSADLRRTTEIIAPVSNAWRRAEAIASSDWRDELAERLGGKGAVLCTVCEGALGFECDSCPRGRGYTTPQEGGL